MMALMPDRVLGAGLLDERYFLFCEEVEWSARIREQGLRIVVEPAAVAWHDVRHGKGGANPTYQYYMTRNRFTLLRISVCNAWSARCTPLLIPRHCNSIVDHGTPG